jgi:hypothetical protein
MPRTNSRPQQAQTSRTLVVNIVVFVALAMVGILNRPGIGAPPTTQEEVARRGAQAMPFDLEQAMHVFQPLADGGLQAVTAKDPTNSAQIALIQAHLQEEVAKFRRGDFSAPATIHGEDMPGLAALRAGAQHIEMQYTPLPNGAQIRYATPDPALTMALHQWFAAQLADHGHHAVGHQ